MRNITKKIEVISRKIFFGMIRFLLEREHKIPKEIKPENIKKVLFLRYDKMGDMIISLPVFRALKEKFPNIHMAVMCSPRNKVVLKGNKNVDEIFVYQKRLFQDIKTVMEMRKRRFDCLIDLVFWESVTSAILTAVVKGGGVSVGVGKGTFKHFYDHIIHTEDRFTEHIIPKTMQVLEIFGIDPKECNLYPYLVISDEDRSIAEQFFEKVKGSPIIGFNISAGQPSRLWPLDKFIKLAQLLKDEKQSCSFVIIYTAGDKKRATFLESKLDSQAVLIPYKSSFHQVSAIIQNLDLLITPDTSLTHIAWSSNISVVGLFCANRENFYSWRPLTPNSRTVMSNSYYHIFDIEPEEVFKVAESLLKEDAK
jgi:ADP-heptose:LPS heptosyltransferase